MSLSVDLTNSTPDVPVVNPRIWRGAFFAILFSAPLWFGIWQAAQAVKALIGGLS